MSQCSVTTHRWIQQREREQQGMMLFKFKSFVFPILYKQWLQVDFVRVKRLIFYSSFVDRTIIPCSIARLWISDCGVEKH